MKKLRTFCLAFLVAFLVAMPVVAQQGEKGERNNNGSGKLHGQARAEHVQSGNKKGDKDPNPSKGSKSKGKKTREGREKTAKHHGSSK